MMKINELQNLIYEAGIVGAGGAGFPTHKKISDRVDTIIVNAAECEPLLKVDHYLLEHHAQEIVHALEVLVDTLDADKGYIGVKKKNIQYLNRLDSLNLKTNKIEIKEIPDIYPAGDEVILTYEVTGKIIPEGNIPLSIGVMVINVETLWNIHRALNGAHVTRKTVTVAGEVKRPVTVNVPVGMPIKELLLLAGVTDLADYQVIMGGPLMGSLCNPETEVVTKTTKGVIVLPAQHMLVQKRKININSVYKRASSACCQCRMCTDMCPRYLLGYSLEVHKTVRTVVNDLTDRLEPYLQNHLCCACGVCDYIACPQDLNPRMISTEVKGRLLKENIRFTNGKAPEHTREERQGRLVPSSRIIERCGLKKYDVQMQSHGEFIMSDENITVNRVILPLKQHVGKPAVPTVSKGQKVTEGQLIAEVGMEDIGANIHASIQGTIEEVNRKEIVIVR